MHFEMILLEYETSQGRLEDSFRLLHYYGLKALWQPLGIFFLIVKLVHSFQTSPNREP